MQPGKSEVHDRHIKVLPLRLEHHVVGLEVAMNNAGGV